nr:hypothetical protein [Tanacetum cinerariifolium]
MNEVAIGKLTMEQSKDEHAYEHVEKVIEITSLFNIPRISKDVIMLRVFPITPTGMIHGSYESSYEVLEGFLRGVVATTKVKQQGGNGGACKVFGWLLGNVMEVLERCLQALSNLHSFLNGFLNIFGLIKASAMTFAFPGWGVVATAEVKQQGGDGGACKVFGWLLGNVMELASVVEFALFSQ